MLSRKYNGILLNRNIVINIPVVSKLFFNRCLICINSGGLHAGQAMKLAAGMRMAETCGAVSGSIMVMGVMVRAHERNLFETRCPEIVRGAAEILEIMLQDQKANLFRLPVITIHV